LGRIKFILMPEDRPKNAPPAPTAEKKARERSPNYPAIGLRKAMDLIKTFWEHDKRQSVMVARATANMGISPKSSSGPLTISALIKYGLLETEGTGDIRKVKLSEPAINLLNPSFPDREELLKQVALAPAIHAKLWEKFGSDGASDGAIHDFLVFELHFTEQAGKALIEEYFDTIGFAKLIAGDSVKATEEDESKSERVEKSPTGVQKQPPAHPVTPSGKQTPTGPQMTAALRYLPIPLDIGDAPIPVGMSEDDFQLLLDTLNLWKKKIVRTVVKPEIETENFDE